MLSRVVDLYWSLLILIVALFLDDYDQAEDCTVPEAEEGGIGMSRGCGCNSP